MAMSFLERLAEQSSLTARQLDVLTSYIRVASGQIKLREAASIASQSRRKGPLQRPLTLGSYYRTVTQARTNVRQSLVTFVVAVRLGLVKIEDARRLLELIGSGTRDLTDEEAGAFLRLLETLLHRIVA
jgi:hypothetical protein